MLWLGRFIYFVGVATCLGSVDVFYACNVFCYGDALEGVC